MKSFFLFVPCCDHSLVYLLRISTVFCKNIREERNDQAGFGTWAVLVFSSVWLEAV